MTTTPPVIDVAIPEDSEPIVSHILNLGGVQIRALAEPHSWLITKAATGSPGAATIDVLRAYVHPDDWAALDGFLSRRRTIDAAFFAVVFDAVTERQTNRPTEPSGDSSES